jgi:hypothetical protein
MDLFRYCLDKELVDSKKRRMGRVDGIIIEWQPDSQPRVVGIEVGAVTLVDRLHQSLARPIIAVLERLGIRSDRYQIAWGKIHVGVNEVRADVDAEETPALEFELWLRKKVIGRIPGA